MVVDQSTGAGHAQTCFYLATLAPTERNGSGGQSPL